MKQKVKKRHLIVVDPIAYLGGSKIAAQHILNELNEDDVKITVVTADKNSWHSSKYQLSPLFECSFLAKQEKGLLFFLKHIFIVFSLLWARLQHGRFDDAIGASGPGVDYSLYLAKNFFSYRILQLIHGPIAASKSLAKALHKADYIYYLESSKKSIANCLQTKMTGQASDEFLNQRHVIAFKNGLPEKQWPSLSIVKSPSVFWAASLLKWKGLELFLKAIKRLNTYSKISFHTHICYIKPKLTNQPISEVPQSSTNISCYASPDHLDDIRKNCNVFVSTSHQEPFGLSILEAMAAGMAIVIPKDGAYWDQQLEDKVQCIKYEPANEMDLSHKLAQLLLSNETIEYLGLQAYLKAFEYKSNETYRSFVQQFSKPNVNITELNMHTKSPSIL